MQLLWLHQHGVCSNYADLLRLPVAVLQDCQMIMVAEQHRAELERG